MITTTHSHKHWTDEGGHVTMGLLGQLHKPGGLLLRAAAKACELVTGRQQLRRAVAAHGWG